MANQKQPTQKLNWFKNASRSTGSLAKQLMGEMMPVTASTASATRDMMRDVRQAGQQFARTAATQGAHLERSRAAKKATAIFNEALADLKSGNFGVKESVDDMFADFDDDISDSFDMNYDESEESKKSPEEIILAGEQGVAKSVIRSASAQLEGMQSMTKAIIGSNLKASDASTKQTINAIMYMGNSMNQNLLGINSTLNVINQNLVQMIEFQNENVSPTNQALVTYLEESSVMMKDLGKMLENYQNSRTGVYKDRSTFSARDGFDIKEYFDFVKKNIKNDPTVSILEMMMSMQDASMSNVGKVVKGAMSAAIPKVLKTAMKDFDANFGTYMQEALNRIGDMSEDPDTIKSMIGSIFGTKRRSISRLNLGNYNKEAMPWNGIAQKALTEVIPEYLASIDAGINKLEKRYFDFESGTFTNESKIRENFFKEREIKFQTSLSEPMEELVNAMKEQRLTAQEQASIIQKVGKIINDRANGLESVHGSRSKLGNALNPLNDEQYRKTVMGLEKAIHEFIESMDDMHEQISSSQSIYRTINNRTEGAAADQYASHFIDPMGFVVGSSFGGSSATTKAIKEILKSCGRTDFSSASNKDLIKLYSQASMGGASEAELRKIVIDFDNRRQLGEGMKGRFSQIFGRKKERGSAIAAKIANIENALFKRSFGTSRESSTASSRATEHSEDSSDDGGPRSSQSISFLNPNAKVEDKDKHQDRRATNNIGAASSNMTRRLGIVAGSIQETGGASKGKRTVATRHQERSTALDQIQNKILKTDTRNVIDQDENTANSNTAIITKEINEQANEEFDTSIEGSIAQLANTNRTGMLAILSSYQNLTSGLFGKNGFIKKIAESEQFKSLINNVKEKLIGEENGIFKDQWKWMKTKGKETLGKTRDHLVDGYDWVYRHTMTYLLGDKYEEDKAYQKYLSKLDLKKNLAVRKARKEAEAKDAKKNEDGTAEQNANEKLTETRDKLLGINRTFKRTSTNWSPKVKIKRPDQVNADGSVTKRRGTIEVDAGNPAQVQSAIMGQITASAAEAADTVKDSGESTAEVLFGDPKKSKSEKSRSFASKFAKTLPKALAAGIAGAGLIAMSGGSLGLLGGLFLPASPIGGAIVGFGSMMLSQTEAFKSILFGKLNDQTGEREGGIINKKMSESFKKAVPMMVGGAVVGALKHVITGGNGIMSHGALGVLTNTLLPGGPLGGAIIGLGLGMLKHGTSFSDKIFGKKDEDGKRSGGALSGTYNKFSTTMLKLMPTLKRGAKGLGIGALTGLTLSKMGLIPALFSLGGPVGMGVAGLTLSIASSSKKFNEMLFGTEEVLEDGTTRRRKDGLLARMRNMLVVHVLDPLAESFKKNFANTKDWIKEAIEFPFRRAFGPIVDSMKGIKNNIVDTITDTFREIGTGIVGIFDSAFKKIFGPFARLAKFMGNAVGGIFSAATKLTLSPVTGTLKLLEFATAGKRRKQMGAFGKAYYGNLPAFLTGKWQEEGTGFFSKLKDIGGAIFNPNNEIRVAAEDAWIAQKGANGENSFDWMRAAREKREHKKEKSARIKEQNTWEKIDKLRQVAANEWDGKEFELKDSNLKYWKKRFQRAGLDSEKIQSSEDLMDLVYRRKEFRNNQLGMKKDEGIKINESPEAKKAHEASTRSANYLEKIYEMMLDASFRDTHKKWDEKTSRKRQQTLKRMRKRSKQNGVDLSRIDSILENDMILGEDFTDEEWQEFRESKFYDAGDLFGFSKDLKKRRAEAASAPTQEEKKEISKEEAKQKKLHVNWLERFTNAAERSAEAGEANAVLATGGKFSFKDILSKVRGGGSTREEALGQFNQTDSEAAANIRGGFQAFLDKITFRKKREARVRREEAEQAHATALGNKSSDVSTEDEAFKKEVETAEKQPAKQSLIGRIFSTVLGATSAIGGLGGGLVGKIGKGIFKTWGIASIMIGLINAISPGFSDKLVNNTEKAVDKIPDFVEDTIAPTVRSVFSFIGNSLGNSINWITKNGKHVYESGIKPVLTLMKDLVVEYGPSFISESARVMTSLIPSMVDAFITVVPALTKALVKGIYDATVGSFFGNGNDAKTVSKDDIVETTTGVDGRKISISDEGKYVYTDPETGELIQTGAREYIGSDGKRHVVKNEGAFSAVTSIIPHTIRTMLQSGAKSTGAKAINLGLKATGAGVGGVGGAVLGGAPGAIAGATTGTKVGGTLGKGVNWFAERLKNIVPDNSVWSKFFGRTSAEVAEAAVEEVSEATAQTAMNNVIDFASAAAKIANEGANPEAARAASKAMTSTAESLGGKVVKIADSVGGEAAETVAKNLDEMAEAALRGSAAAAAEAGEEVMRAESTGLLKKLLTWIRSLTENTKLGAIIEEFGSKFGNKAGRGASVLSRIATWFEEVIQAMFAKLESMGAAKAGGWLDRITNRMAKNSAKALLTIITTGWDGVTGAMEAENLFHVPSGQATIGMRVISSCMKMLLGIFPFGTIVDIVVEVAGAIAGKDYKSKLATLLYTSMSEIFGDGSAAESLQASQDQLELERQIYQSLTGSNIDADAYNDLTNPSVWKSITSSIQSIWNEDVRNDRKIVQQAREQAQRLYGSGTTTTFRSTSTGTTTGYGSGITFSNTSNASSLGYGNVPMKSLRSATNRVLGFGPDDVTTPSTSLTDKVVNAKERSASTVVNETKIVERIIRLINNFASSTSAQKVMDAFKSKLPSRIYNVIEQLAGFLRKMLNKMVRQLKVKHNKNRHFWMRLEEKLTRKGGNLLGDVSTIGTAAFKAVTFGVTFGYDIITGGLEAPNLFHVSNGNVDFLMRTISAIVKALCGTFPFGTIFDIMNDLASELTGFDFKYELATYLYSILGGDENSSKLQASQAQLALEAQVFNELNKSTLSLDDYNNLKNKYMLSNIADSVKMLFGNSELKKERDLIKQAETIARNSKSDAVGYGSGFSQNDPRWKNQRIGTMPNGTASTMGNGGCGPTALAMAANDLTGGKLTPSAVGSFASRNGYISSGGANAGLFTEGAARLGIASKPVTDTREMAARIAGGSPVILSGQSTSSRDPYTKAGHIVVAEGMDSAGKVNVKDPIDGRTKRYRLSDLAKNTTAGFALGRGAIGYGHVSPEILAQLGYGPSIDLTPDPASFSANVRLNSSTGASTTASSVIPSTIVKVDPSTITTSNSTKTTTSTSTSSKRSGTPTILTSQFTESYNAAKTALGLSSPNLFNTESTQNFYNGLTSAQIITLATNALQRGLVCGASDLTLLKTSLATMSRLGTWTYTSSKKTPVTEKLSYEQRARASLILSLMGYEYRGNEKTLRPLVRDMFFWSDTIDFASAWDEGLIPQSGEFLVGYAYALNVSDPSFMISRVTSNNVSMVTFLNALLGYQSTLSEGSTRYKEISILISNLQNKFSVDDSSIVPPKDLLERLTNNLLSHSISEYNANSINGYVMYDMTDANWSDLKYGDRTMSEWAKQSTDRTPYDLMALSTLLSTYTGRPFTPKFLIEDMLPYMDTLSKNGTDLPYNKTTGMYDLDKLLKNSKSRSNLFDLDFIRDDNDAKIEGERVHVGGNNISGLKEDLKKHYGHFMFGKLFDGSIFGGSSALNINNSGELGVTDEYQKVHAAFTSFPTMPGFLQSYTDENDMLQYMGMDQAAALYTKGKNIFEKYFTEQFADGTLRLKKSDGSAPPFETTDNQLGILAEDLNAPNAEEEDNGPFALLTKLLSYISTGMSNMITNLVAPSSEKKSGMDIWAPAVEKIKNIGGALMGYGDVITPKMLVGNKRFVNGMEQIKSTLGFGSGPLGYGPITDTLSTGTSMLNDALSLASGIGSDNATAETLSSGTSILNNALSLASNIGTNKAAMEAATADATSPEIDYSTDTASVDSGSGTWLDAVFAPLADMLGQLGVDVQNKIGQKLYGDNWQDIIYEGGSSSGGGTSFSNLSYIAPQTVGSAYKVYSDLTDDQKLYIAKGITGETGGSDIVAARQEASQMVNLTERTYGQNATGATIIKQLNNGWYNKNSFKKGATDIAKQAVLDVIVGGKRTLPRYVVEHDMFPGDIKNAKDRSSYKFGDAVSNRYGSNYQFYDFFGKNKTGDIAGFFKSDYDKYKDDVPWGFGRGPLGFGPTVKAVSKNASTAAIKYADKINSKGLSALTPNQLANRGITTATNTTTTESTMESSNATSGLEQAFSSISRAAAAKLYSKLYGVSMDEAYNMVDAGGGSTGSVSGGGYSSVNATIYPVADGASANEAKLINLMNSKVGKVAYSLSGPQDPDKGSASCASMVGWAYRKALGVNGMSASSTEQSKDNRFHTIWVKKSAGDRVDSSILRPGDIAYFNWDRANAANSGKMQHTEMYAGGGRDLNHGGPGYGPVYKDLGDYRKARIMMIRRYNGFANMGNGLGYGTGMDDYDAQAERIWSDSVLGKTSSTVSIDTGHKTFSTPSRVTAADKAYYGVGSGSSTENLEVILKTGTIEQKLDAIGSVVSDWHNETKAQPKAPVTPVTVTSNTTNNIAANNNNGTTVRTTKNVQKPDNGNLRNLHNSIARVKR